MFFFIGRYTATKQDIHNVKKYVDKLKPKRKPGIIPFKTPEELMDERTGDKDLEDEWIRSGKAEEVMK